MKLTPELSAEFITESLKTKEHKVDSIVFLTFFLKRFFDNAYKKGFEDGYEQCNYEYLMEAVHEELDTTNEDHI